MTARQYLAQRIAGFVSRYTGKPEGFDEPVVQAAEAAVDAAVKSGSATLKRAIDQWEQSLVLTDVLRCAA